FSVVKPSSPAPAVILSPTNLIRLISWLLRRRKKSLTSTASSPAGSATVSAGIFTAGEASALTRECCSILSIQTPLARNNATAPATSRQTIKIFMNFNFRVLLHEFFLPILAHCKRKRNRVLLDIGKQP